MSRFRLGRLNIRLLILFLVVLSLTIIIPSTESIKAASATWYAPNGTAIDDLVFYAAGPREEIPSSILSIGLNPKSPIEITPAAFGNSYTYLMDNYSSPSNFDVNDTSVLDRDQSYIYRLYQVSADGTRSLVDKITVTIGTEQVTVCTGIIRILPTTRVQYSLIPRILPSGSESCVYDNAYNSDDYNFTTLLADSRLYDPFYWSGQTAIGLYGDGTLNRLNAEQEAILKDPSFSWVFGSSTSWPSQDINEYELYSTAACTSGFDWQNPSAGDGFALIAVHSGDFSKAYLFEKKGGEAEMTGHWPPNGGEVSCLFGDDNGAPHQDALLDITYWETRTASGPETPAPVTPGGGGAAGEAELTCENSGINFGWIICEVIKGAEKIISGMYPAMQTQFKVFSDFTDQGGNTIIGIGSNENIQGIWNGFRTIARGLLILVLSVIIIQQATGLGLIDAYSLKKIVPRLAVAVVGVELSWLLVDQIGVIVEEVGDSLPGLLYAPFSNDMGGATSLNLTVVFGESSWDSLFGVVAFGYLALNGLFAVLLPLAIGVALAIILAFFTLIFRRVAIILLAVMVPLAIIAWILPNTQSLFKRWSGVFFKLLLMYPLIQLLIAGGAVAAKIGTTNTTPSDTDFYGSIARYAAVIAFFAPYFLVPFTFKFVGGVLGNIAGIASDKGRGIIDRPRKMLQDKRAYRRQERQKYTIDQKRNENLGRIGSGVAGRFAGVRRFAMRRRANLPFAITPGARRRQSNIEGEAGAEYNQKEIERQAQAMSGNLSGGFDADGRRIVRWSEPERDSHGRRTGRYVTRDARHATLPEDAKMQSLASVLNDRSRPHAQRAAAARLLAQRKKSGYLRTFVSKTVASGDVQAQLEMKRIMSDNFPHVNAVAPDVARTLAPDVARGESAVGQVIGLGPHAMAGWDDDTHEALIQQISTQQELDRYYGALTGMITEPGVEKSTGTADAAYKALEGRADELGVDIDAPGRATAREAHARMMAGKLPEREPPVSPPPASP